MALRRLRRKWRCVLKHGPRGCPHIERHTRRSRRRPRVQAVPLPELRPPTMSRVAPSLLQHQPPVTTPGRHSLL